MSRFNNKRNTYILIALVTLILIGIGYAFLTSNLNIIGSTAVKRIHGMCILKTLHQQQVV